MLVVMRFRMASALGVFLMLSAYADGSVSTDLDRRDERVRTYVSPKRMVMPIGCFCRSTARSANGPSRRRTDARLLMGATVPDFCLISDGSCMAVCNWG